MARAGPHGIGHPRIPKRFGQSIAKTTKNVQRKVVKSGFRFSKNKRRPGRGIGFGFKNTPN